MHRLEYIYLKKNLIVCYLENMLNRNDIIANTYCFERLH